MATHLSRLLLFALSTRLIALFLLLYRAYGDAKHCRKVLARAINSATDWPELVFEACLRFEREEGSLETFVDVRTKIEQQRARLAERAQAVSKQKMKIFVTQSSRTPQHLAFLPAVHWVESEPQDHKFGWSNLCVTKLNRILSFEFHA